MKFSILGTFLQLGDATSHNLAFSHKPDVGIRYGEETITEINLLELRRHHLDKIYIQTLTKKQESIAGADWEWHIVGHKLTAKMRVQAKRLQSTGTMKIKHMVASTGKQQRNLLIDKACIDNMKPVYCIYCTEKQRKVWIQPPASDPYVGYKAGCLLADAYDVALETSNLDAIEDKCIPWHYLFERYLFGHRKFEFHDVYDAQVLEKILEKKAISHHRELHSLQSSGDGDRRADDIGWKAPTVEDLNRDTGRDFDRMGVSKTEDKDIARVNPETPEGQEIRQLDRERLRERGIHRMVVIDARTDPVEEP